MSQPAQHQSHDSTGSDQLHSQFAFAGPRLNPAQFLTRDENFSRSQLTSILIHCAFAVIVLLPLFARIVPPP